MNVFIALKGSHFWFLFVSIFMYLNTTILYVILYILSHVKSERPRFSRGFPILATGFFSLVFHPGFSEFIMGGHKSVLFPSSMLLSLA